MGIALIKKYSVIVLLRLCTTGILAVSAGCSSETAEISEQKKIAYSNSSDSGIDYGKVEEAQSPEAQGWRRGVLTVKYSLQQTESLSSRGKGDSLDINSNLNMQVTSVEDVWLAADLSTLVEKSDDVNLIRASYRASPWFRGNDLSPATVNSRIAYTSRSILTNGELQFEESEQASGEVPGLHIDYMQPSLYGEGYELALTINMHLLVKQQHASFGATITDERLVTDPFQFKLYPVPSDRVINAYPYSREEVQYHKKIQDLETFSLLQKKYASPRSPLLSHCIGAITQLSKDTLSVRYSYEGPNWMPMLSDKPTGAAKNTKLGITVQLAVK